MSNEYRFKDVKAPSDIKPVGWYDPSQLMDTANRVIESETFARNADRRINFTEWEEKELAPITFQLSEEPAKSPSEAKSDIHQSVYNDFYIGSHRKVANRVDWQSELWVDFLADTGDGGNATYTVAKTLFQDQLAVTYHDDLTEENLIRKVYPRGLPKPLPRADLLVLGGDLVYPTANDETYQNRFINLFKAALPNRQKLPIHNEKDATRAVVSFPQNHDWYDNLSSFFMMFCHKEKATFLDMKCPQWQSYAAVKLPFDWWLFGLDLALSDDIDEIQHLYFSKIIDKESKNSNLNSNSRIIITYKEPVWFLTALGNSKNKERAYFYEDIEAKIEDITGREIDIRLAGDQHYYRRYSKKVLNPQSHLITCGSGGAFLHPTHGPKEFNQINHLKPQPNSENALLSRTYMFANKSKPTAESHIEYEKKCDYPLSKISWGLSKRNFRFFTINPWFGSITAISYLFLVWANFSSLYGNLRTANFGQNGDKCDNTTQSFEKSLSWFGNCTDWIEHMSNAWRLWGWSSILAPINGLIGLFIIFGFAYFTQKFNPHAKIWSGILGALHGLTHFFVIFIIYFFILKYFDYFTYGFSLLWFFIGFLLIRMAKNANSNNNHATKEYFFKALWIFLYLLVLGLFIYQISSYELKFHPRDPIKASLEFIPFTVTAVLVLFLGFIAGCTLMGGYLFVSLNLYSLKVLAITLMVAFILIWFVFTLWFDNCWLALVPTGLVFAPLVYIFKNRKNLELENVPFIHSNEAFSSLRIEDYKGFLRFKITKEKLEAFFIGVDNIPKKWEETKNPKQPKWEAVDKAIQPKLVDYWTVETIKNPGE